MTTTDGIKSTKILLLRSYSKAPFSIKVSRAINRCHSVQFMQYPVWPTDQSYHDDTYKFHKIGLEEKALDEINRNVITTYEDLDKKLKNNYFDFCILVDHNATLFDYHDASISTWLKSYLAYRFKSLFTRSEKLSQAYNYKYSLPLSLKQLSNLIPIVSIDFAGSVYLSERNRMILENSFLFFKRELPFDRFLLYGPGRPAPWATKRMELLPLFDKIVGIPLGIEDDKYSALKLQRVKEKEIDVFISGAITNTLRNKALDYINKIANYSSLNIVIKKTVPFQEYCDLTAKSKVTISIAGSRWECFRHYEAIALGSLPLMNKPTIDAAWWHDMPDEIFFENTFSNFVPRLEQLVTDDELRARCFAAIEGRIEDHMLHSKIMDYVINTTYMKMKT